MHHPSTFVRQPRWPKNLMRGPVGLASPRLSSLAMNNFEEDTVIMAHDATNGIDKLDILDDK